MKVLTSLAAIAAVSFGIASDASAAVVVDVVQVTAVNNTTLDADLTALGTTDWVIWNAWTGTTGVEYDSKSGGSGIGALGYIGGQGTVTELTNAAGRMRLDYTDGTTFLGTQSDINEGIGRRIGDSPSTSPDGTLTLSTTVNGTSGSLHMFVSGNNRVRADANVNKNAQPQSFAASIGAVSDTVSPSWESVDALLHIRVAFSGLTGGEALNINWAADGTDFNSRIIMNAAALNVVPEPASLALLGLGGLTLLRRRRA